MTDLYSTLKSYFGNNDDLAHIMSDSDHPRQQSFLLLLPTLVPSEKHRQVLLDGLAREFAGVEGWMAYVSREC